MRTVATIQYQKGDIFSADAHVIVNTVNCKGVMGKGLALQFKQKYPEMFTAYRQACKTGQIRIGKPMLFQDSKPWILNFPTKDHWRQPSKIEYIAEGLEYIVAMYKKLGITSIAFPKLGTQNGKLSWVEVGPVMAKYLDELNIPVTIFIADNDKEYQAQTDSSIPEKAENQIKQPATKSAISTVKKVKAPENQPQEIQNQPQKKRRKQRKESPAKTVDSTQTTKPDPKATKKNKRAAQNDASLYARSLF